MDDLWGNAWGDPTESSFNSHAKTSPWSSKPQTQPVDEETDIAMPSWSTGTAIQWNEPSENEASLWSQAPPPARWSPTNAYSDLAIGKPHFSEAVGSSSRSSTPKEDVSSSPPNSPPSHTFERNPPLSKYPDAFGGFETGEIADNIDAWHPSPGDLEDDIKNVNGWGSAWADTEAVESTRAEQEAIDEWEAAKRQKEAMDRRVPPELLANILQQVEELSRTVWPQPESLDEEPEWRKKLHIGMDTVEGLDALMNRYTPSMTLPQLKTFPQSFTGKAMINSLKLSRNIPLSKSSPMANFLAAKGSVAWETSIKSRVDVVQDEVPAGWRIMEKDMEREKVEEKTKRGGGGLLASLWNRRASSTPREGTQVTSPVQEGSSAFIASKVVPSLVSSSTSSAGSPAASATQTAPITSVLASPSTTPQTPYSESGLPSFEPFAPPEAQMASAPSAVSRFFNRFSRSRVPSSLSPRNSMALSTDDLEFLSDLVPSANDVDANAEEKDIQLRSLASMIASKPIGGKLPAPLPPPPSASSAVKSAPPSANGSGTKSPNGSLMSFDVLTPNLPEKSPSPVTTASSSTLPPPLAPSLRPLVPLSRPLSPAPSPLTPPNQSSRSQVQRAGRTNSRSSMSSVLPSPGEVKTSHSTFPLPPSSTRASSGNNRPTSATSSSFTSSRSQSPGLLPPPPPPSVRPSPLTVAPSPRLAQPPLSSKPMSPSTSATSILSSAFDGGDSFTGFHSSSPAETFSFYDTTAPDRQLLNGQQSIPQSSSLSSMLPPPLYRLRLVPHAFAQSSQTALQTHPQPPTHLTVPRITLTFTHYDRDDDLTHDHRRAPTFSPARSQPRRAGGSHAGPLAHTEISFARCTPASTASRQHGASYESARRCGRGRGLARRAPPLVPTPMPTQFLSPPPVSSNRLTVPGGSSLHAPSARRPDLSPESMPLAYLVPSDPLKPVSVPPLQPAPTGAGGLSAQDLSFFEGL
ncbi:hypothetical protein EW146_g6770 [Bondarzewia mesenterica]|uniref:Uncharacterized protein n=1 Tax=Bondarzewia mesenterica TaxID=1095465 RepID=A0A4S4LMK1_9AGAM|nr:hypothetical protein EW146_g6770 [Bondarzewia mesenterica]